MRTEEEIKVRIASIKYDIAEINEELETSLNLSILDEIGMLDCIEELKNEVSALEWVLNEK